MADWTGGYTSDVEYTASYHRHIEPHQVRFAALCSDVDCPDRPLRYCELGTGRGITAMGIAAANPDIEVHATDFAPGQIASARRLAQEADLRNMHFYDDSFAQFRDNKEIPAKFDMIVFHGIYSWVDETVRRDMVAFVDERLEPGGLCFVSYNALPGWSAGAPTRHLMHMTARQTEGTSRLRLKAGIDLVEKMVKAEARYFQESARARGIVERVSTMDSRYVVHEYLNDAWDLFYHSDVAADMAEARLNFVGTGSLLERIDALNITDEQAAILSDIADPTLREVVRDYMMNTQFRRDVFARGALKMSAVEAAQAWRETAFALIEPRGDVKLVAKGTRGEGKLDGKFYEPVLDAIADGPKTAEFLSTVVKEAGGTGNQLVQVLTVLTGKGTVVPRPAETTHDEERRAACERFNRLVLEKSKTSGEINNLVSPVAMTAVSTDRLTMRLIIHWLAGHHEAGSLAAELERELTASGNKVVHDGKTLEDPAEQRAHLDDRAKTFVKDRVPHLKMLGII